MYNNQLDTLFILSLLNYHTSVCFELINSHHQVVECIYVANYTRYTSKFTDGGYNKYNLSHTCIHILPPDDGLLIRPKHVYV
jgi:hypothetical protein